LLLREPLRKAIKNKKDLIRRLVCHKRISTWMNLSGRHLLKYISYN
jgi:hypothetical protein